MPNIFGMDELINAGFVSVDDVSSVLGDLDDRERGGMIIHAGDNGISIFAGVMPYRLNCIYALVSRVARHTSSSGNSFAGRDQELKLRPVYRQLYSKQKLVAQVFIEADDSLQTSATVIVPIPLTVPDFQDWVEKTVFDVRNHRMIKQANP